MNQLENVDQNSTSHNNTDMSLQQEIEFMSEVSKELTRKSLYDFTMIVGEKHSQNFGDKYSLFSSRIDHILRREMTTEMYGMFKI